MRIAFIGQKGIPVRFGGVERHAENLAVRLAAAGNEVIVYTRPNYTDPGLREYRGIELVSLSSIVTKHLDAISHTFRACIDVLRRDVDIIHFHSIGPSSLIWLVKLLKPNTPIVATFHAQCYQHKKWGAPARGYLRFAEAVCCNLADRVIVVSKNLHKYATKKYGRVFHYIPNGANFDRIEATDKIEAWGLYTKNYLLTVSRLVEHKGIHHLVEAFKRLETDKKLVIVGDGAFTDDYVKRLKALARGDDRIIFTGNQTGETLGQLFSNAYLFVQPSESEGLSISLLEAMAVGLPVLTSDVPENREAIGNDGLTFRSRSIVDLTKKIKELLENGDLAATNGRANSRRVDEFYNWDKIVFEVINLYDELLFEQTARKRFARFRFVGRFISLLF